jgi:thioredoxin-related protein
MKKYTLIILTLIIALFTSGSLFSQTSHNLTEGLSLAKSQNKKVLINICDENDNWCSRMEKEVYSKPELRKYIEDNFIYVKMNASSNESYMYKGKNYSGADFQKLFGITGYPSHIFLNSAGEPIVYKYNKVDTRNFAGYIDAEGFSNLLKYFNEDKYKDKDLSSEL